jgi:hypothetical protein
MQAAAGGGGGGGEEEGPDEVAGFVFSRLLERRPALRQELLTFRDHLLAAASQEQVLKVSERAGAKRRTAGWWLLALGLAGEPAIHP